MRVDLEMAIEFFNEGYNITFYGPHGEIRTWLDEVADLEEVWNTFVNAEVAEADVDEDITALTIYF